MLPTGPQVWNDKECGDERGDADGHIDEEDPTPVDVCDQRAADGRAGQRRQACDTAPDPERRAAPLRREDRGQDRQRLRCQQRAADSLQDSRRDQLAGVL